VPNQRYPRSLHKYRFSLDRAAQRMDRVGFSFHSDLATPWCTAAPAGYGAAMGMRALLRGKETRSGLADVLL